MNRFRTVTEITPVPSSDPQRRAASIQPWLRPAGYPEATSDSSDLADLESRDDAPHILHCKNYRPDPCIKKNIPRNILFIDGNSGPCEFFSNAILRSHRIAMTIVSHKHQFIFLKSRKTAGSSVEGWLAPLLGQRDLVITSDENRRLPVLSTPHPVTRFAAVERPFKKALRLVRPGFRLDQHSDAVAVRLIVGEDVWRRYYKFSIERQPWDRLLSLWSWRQHRLKREISFDHFLDRIESNDGDPLVQYWSNLPSYTGECGSVIVDRVLDYANLHGELTDVARELRLPLAVSDLPRHKSGIRGRSHGVASLSRAQIERVSRLCRAEIELFGWQEPGAMQTA